MAREKPTNDRQDTMPDNVTDTETSLIRCEWCGDDPLYVRYHDEEWGVPVRDDRKHFEFLLLESAQAGLSWLTILRKRENYRRAFDDFDPEQISRYGENDVNRLLGDAGIVRNRAKIRSAINNARRFLDVREEYGSFDRYIWSWVDGIPVLNAFRKLEAVPASTSLSEKISKDMKNRGFTFVGPTIIYAHLQATGIVNDHIIDCFRRAEIVDSESRS